MSSSEAVLPCGCLKVEKEMLDTGKENDYEMGENVEKDVEMEREIEGEEENDDGSAPSQSNSTATSAAGAATPAT